MRKDRSIRDIKSASRFITPVSKGGCKHFYDFIAGAFKCVKCGRPDGLKRESKMTVKEND